MQATSRWITLPLYTQVLIAVTGGALLGAIFGQESYMGGESGSSSARTAWDCAGAAGVRSP